MTPDPRVDAYISKAAEFAQPLLRTLRGRAQEIAPQAEEAIKWGMPALTYCGKILCGYGGFKAHVVFYVHGASGRDQSDGMGSFGKMSGPADLPSKTEMSALLKARIREIEAGPKPALRRKAPKPPLEIPADLAKALKTSAAAAKTFDAFAPSHRREYIEWITEAKREETRLKRVKQAVEWLAEGKSRNWKYEKKKPL